MSWDEMLFTSKDFHIFSNFMFWSRIYLGFEQWTLQFNELYTDCAMAASASIVKDVTL